MKHPGPALEQSLSALEVANQTRTDRKALRLSIEAGASAADALEAMPSCIRGAGVFQFLTYMPMVGRNTRGASTSRAFVLLRKASLTQVGHKRLDAITDAQRARLARVVREYEDARHPAERGIA